MIPVLVVELCLFLSDNVDDLRCVDSVCFLSHPRHSLFQLTFDNSFCSTEITDS